MDQTYENAWKDSPEPPIRYDAQMPRTKRKQTVLERFRNAVRQDRLGAACCAILLFFFLLTGALWLQRLADMRENVRMITYYRDLESYYNNENAKIEQRIASAMDGASIRNLAQNSLGMLRPERANTQEIYIQLPDEEEYRSAQSGEEVKPELLDLVLGFLGRMHIGE